MLCEGMKALSNWTNQPDYDKFFEIEVDQYSSLLTNIDALLSVKTGSGATM